MGKHRGRLGKAARKEAEKQAKDEEQHETYEYHMMASQEEALQPQLPLPDDDLVQYLITAEQVLQQNTFPSDEDRTVFIHSVFDEIGEKSWLVAAHGDGSRILEMLLVASVHYEDAEERIWSLLKGMQGRTLEFCMHLFTSHVVQMVLVLAAEKIDRAMTKGNMEDGCVKAIQETLMQIVDDEIRTGANMLLIDRYGSHVLRAVMVLLASGQAAQHSDKTVIRSNKSKKFNEKAEKVVAEQMLMKKRKVPKAFSGLLAGIIKDVARGFDANRVRELALDPVASPVLQLCLALGHESQDEAVQDAVHNLIDKLLSGYISNPDDGDIHARDSFINLLLKDQNGSHLMERILFAMDAITFQRFFTDYFRNKLESLTSHPIANFVVQRLIGACRNSAQFELIAAELLPDASTLIQTRAGVIKCMFEQCVKLHSSYRMVLNGLCDALGLKTSTERLHLVPKLLGDGSAVKDETKFGPRIDINRSLILQTVFRFPEECIDTIISSLMHQSPEALSYWARHPVASHVMESFFSSPNVAIKAKRRLTYKLLSEFPSLAKNKYGSHLVDQCWKVADIQVKEKLAEGLLAHKDDIIQDFHGQMVWRNCRLDDFKRKKEVWLEYQKSAIRKQEMFEDILNDDVQTKKPKTTGQRNLFENEDQDEIDTLFKVNRTHSTTLAAPDKIQVHEYPSNTKKSRHKDLDEVLDALDSSKKRKKRKKDKHAS